jgi:BirA family biotin operon repressor/biotin-[acetyl-CoA-carboxylase] ligase
MPDWPSAKEIRADLGTKLFGQELVCLAVTSSTNDEARRLAEAGAVEGTVVVADHQTAGRGRLDRRWEAPPGSSLLLSLLFRPGLAAHQVQRLTMICGLAAADAVETQTGLQVGLKWPNDITVGGAKVGGILTEIGLSGDKVDYAIVGMGLNVNLEPGRLPGGLLMPATSLSHLMGRRVARLPLLQTLLRAIEARYLALQAGHSPQGEWLERLITLGQPVVVSGAGDSWEGMAEGVDKDGALLVRLADGRLQAVLAGDVTLRPRAPRPPRASCI